VSNHKSVESKQRLKGTAFRQINDVFPSATITNDLKKYLFDAIQLMVKNDNNYLDFVIFHQLHPIKSDRRAAKYQSLPNRSRRPRSTSSVFNAAHQHTVHEYSFIGRQPEPGAAIIFATSACVQNEDAQ
jgi:hypothetical protein